MATVNELAQDVLSSVSGKGCPVLTAAKWIDNRYKEMVSKVKFRHLRKVGELAIPGVYDTGTVSLDRGDATVTGDSTQLSTDVTAAGGAEYCFFRASSAWYAIETPGSETTMELSTAFAEDDVDDASYDLVKRHHPLASDARWIGDFYFTRLRRTLPVISLAELDILSPGRTLAGHIPSEIAQVGTDSNGYLMVEVYPPPVDSEILHYIYWALPTALAISSTIPSVIDPYTLKEGALVDLYRYEKSVALRKGNVEEAAVWRNEEKTQMTIWKRAIDDAIRTSRGADDLTIILEMFRGVPSGRGEQRTAHDYITDNWNWSR